MKLVATGFLCALIAKERHTRIRSFKTGLQFVLLTTTATTNPIYKMSSCIISYVDACCCVFQCYVFFFLMVLSLRQMSHKVIWELWFIGTNFSIPYLTTVSPRCSVVRTFFLRTVLHLKLSYIDKSVDFIPFKFDKFV